MTMIKRKNRQCRPLNQCCDRAYSAGKGLCMLHEDGGGGDGDVDGDGLATSERLHKATEM